MLRLGLLGGLVALPGMLVLAELLAWGVGQPLLPTLERLTGDWCHHDPARTLRIGEHPLPVCARCTGLYAGLVLGPPIGWLLPRQGPRLVQVVALALAPMVMALGAAVLEAAGTLATSNPVRLGLGALLTVGPMALGSVGARILCDVWTEAASGPRET